jgi:dihydrofolate synthase / folylpolyglutamate synthase
MEKLLQEILKKKTKSKLKLKEVKLLDKLFDFPSKKFKSIHVAGTNGKGSLCTKIASALTHSGYKVGLYTSPHIRDYNERIKVNGRKIPLNKLKKDFSLIYKKALEHRIYPNFFEVMTIVAFIYFAEEKVDFAVIETGLGGRLDATNIVTPILSIITSISFDHTDILGETLEKIAFEKAGIIKKNVDVLIGPNADFKAIKKKAKKCGSLLLKPNVKSKTFDEQNSFLAKEALLHLKKKFFISEKAIAKGIKDRPECRFEVYGKNDKIFKNIKPCHALILDVAHNPDGFKNLFQTIHCNFPYKKIRLVFGISKNKDIKRCIEIILLHTNCVHLIDSANERLISKNNLFKLFPKKSELFLSYELSLKKELKNAISLASKKDEILVISGSFFIMKTVKEALKIKNNYS